MSTRTEENRRKGKWALRICMILLLLATVAAAAVFGFFFFKIRSGRDKLSEPGAYRAGVAEPYPDCEWLTWDGEMYQYREGLINILCLGIDGRETAEENPYIGFGPRADCIVLASFDTKERTLTFLNISRESITPIRWYDSIGKEVGLYDYYLGLQYTLSDGLDGSCRLMEEAVSRMLGGIPIHGYCALYWNGVAALQEETGPVTVTVPVELHELDSEHFPESGEVELTPEQAQIFVQGRDITVTGSNEIRLLRQQAYMEALYQKVKGILVRNPLSIFSMQEAVEDYLVTDLDTEEILALAWTAARVKEDGMTLLSVPGETVDTMFQDEYHIDEEQLTELLAELFYSRIEQAGCSEAQRTGRSKAQVAYHSERQSGQRTGCGSEGVLRRKALI